MMRRTNSRATTAALACACLCLVGCRTPEAPPEVYLRNVETGLLYGPVEAWAPTDMTMPGGTYRVTEPKPDDIHATHVLRSSLVDCDLTNASMETVGMVLGKVCSPLGFSVRVDTNRVSFIIHSMCSLSDDIEVNGPQTPPITITARYVSVFQLLEIISRRTGRPIRVDGSTVVIGAALTPEEDKAARQALFNRFAEEASEGRPSAQQYQWRTHTASNQAVQATAPKVAEPGR